MALSLLALGQRIIVALVLVGDDDAKFSISKKHFIIIIMVGMSALP